MTVTITARHRCFDGDLLYCTHLSRATGTPMAFTLFLPPEATSGPVKAAVPVITYLAGLTCTPETFTTKGGAYKTAAELGLAIVAPDTSPRGDGVADDPDGAYDFGLGAGFYLDATVAPYSDHYHMKRYITEDLQQDLFAAFDCLDRSRQGIFGHSMGGHGALTLGLTRPDIFTSISAFAPIANPSACPWGEKAFTGYLGPDRAAWKAYDATEIMLAFEEKSRGDRHAILIDQGLSDQFLAEQLHPQAFVKASERAGQQVSLRTHEGYDHGYFFISSFMSDHLEFHHKAVRG